MAIAITGIALFWLFSAGWLTRELLGFLQNRVDAATAPFIAPRTAIVLLGGGTRYDRDHRLVPKSDVYPRIALAADTYAACRKRGARCTVIVSGGNPQRHTMAEADNYLPWLLARNVPRTDILLENRSLNTYQNARNVAAIARQTGYDAMILITSAYHMPRALLDFHRFGLAPQALPSNVRTARCEAWPRTANLIDAELALHELIGIAQFHVYRRLGWF